MPRSSSGEVRTPAGTRSQRRWIWSGGDDTGREEEFVVESGDSFETVGDLGVEAAAGRKAGPGNKFAFEAGFGGAVQAEDKEKTVIGVGAELEFVVVRETVWGPRSLSGHLGR